jgi:hypothetical protein
MLLIIRDINLFTAKQPVTALYSSVTLEKSAALLQERTALLEAAKDVLSQESEEEEGARV